MNAIEQQAHSIFAGAASTAVAASALSQVEDILLRGVVSVCFGVITWFITQMLSRRFKKK